MRMSEEMVQKNTAIVSVTFCRERCYIVIDNYVDGWMGK